jgi:hypothetical protein
MLQLSQQRDILQLAEAFLDPLPPSLADGIPRMANRPCIDCATAAPTGVPGHVRRHSQMPTLGDELRRVVSFVGTGSHTLHTRRLFQHKQCGIALRSPIRFQQLRVDDQPLRFSTSRLPL